MENENGVQAMEQITERLTAAALQLECAIAGMEERHAHACGDVQRIVATAESAYNEQRDSSRLELERKLISAERKIASLQAQIEANAMQGGTGAARKTVTGNAVQMFSKMGPGEVGGIEAGTLDAALTGLSLEQRIAVKAQLARAGFLS